MFSFVEPSESAAEHERLLSIHGLDPSGNEPARRSREVWDAVRDVGAIHTRLAPDFVTNVTMDGDARIVTFANGMTAKELIVDVNDAARRLVWAVVEGRPTHHNGSIQIFPDGGGSALSGSPTSCRMNWQSRSAR